LIIPPHPPLVKGGWGDLEIYFLSNPMTYNVWTFEFGHWLLFDYWCLEFGNYCFIHFSFLLTT
jgi:hypothetical protein